MQQHCTSSADELATQLDAILDTFQPNCHWSAGSSRTGYQIDVYIPADWNSDNMQKLVTDTGRAFGHMQTSYRHPTLADALTAAIDKLTDIIGEVYNDDHQVAA